MNSNELLEEAVNLIAEWCVAIEDRGSGWGDWDHYYKEASFRPTQTGTLRKMIDKEKAEVRKRWKE